MASLLQSPKSANDWSNNDLAAFNIQVVNAAGNSGGAEGGTKENRTFGLSGGSGSLQTNG